jgi:hypothetical protein
MNETGTEQEKRELDGTKSLCSCQCWTDHWLRKVHCVRRQMDRKNSRGIIFYHCPSPNYSKTETRPLPVIIIKLTNSFDAKSWLTTAYGIRTFVFIVERIRTSFQSLYGFVALL